MSNLSIKDVPEEWAEALRQRAARHHRSLQGELMAIIESVVQADAATSPPGRTSHVSGYDKRGWPVIRQGGTTIEESMAKLRVKYPQPVADQISGVELIREDRDSR